MGLKISGLNELRERLERLRPEEVMAPALAEQAARMAARVREGLSEGSVAATEDASLGQGAAAAGVRWSARRNVAGEEVRAGLG